MDFRQNMKYLYILTLCCALVLSISCRSAPEQQDSQKQQAGKVLQTLPNKNDTNIVIPRHWSLVGTVVDFRDGSRVEDCAIITTGTQSISAHSNSNGLFRLDTLNTNQSYRIMITTDGYRRYLSEILTAPQNSACLETTFWLIPQDAVTGRIIDEKDDAGVGNVEVWFARDGLNRTIDDISSATTTGDGQFYIDGISTGTYFVEINPPDDYLPLRYQIYLSLDMDGDIGIIEIMKSGSLEGKVIQSSRKNAIPGIKIILTRGDAEHIQTYTTDTSGVFEFRGLTEGTYHLSLEQFPYSTTLFVKAGETRSITFEIKGGTVRGSIYRNNKPVSAHVGLLSFDHKMSIFKKTDTAGFFEVNNILPGSWQITISLPDNPDQSINEWLEIEPESVVERTFHIPAGRLIGKVLNARNQPIHRAMVSIVKARSDGDENYIVATPASTQTESDGSFLFDDLAVGYYGVAAHTEGLGIAIAEDISVPDRGESEPVVLRLGTTNGGTLISITVDKEDGSPIDAPFFHVSTMSGVRVPCTNRRDEQGTVTIRDLPPGIYLLEIGGNGYSYVEHVVEIRSGEEKRLLDSLDKAGDLHVMICDNAGYPLARVPCRLEALSSGLSQTTRAGMTNEDGVWLAIGLLPGEYLLSAEVAGKTTLSQTIQINVSDVTSVSLMAE